MGVPQGIIGKLIFGNQDPEKVARKNAQEKWENSLEYKMQEDFYEFRNKFIKILKFTLKLKEMERNQIDTSKIFEKFKNKKEEKDYYYQACYLDIINGESKDYDEKYLWGLNDKEVNRKNKGGIEHEKNYRFYLWFLHQILNKTEVYEWILQPRVKEEFELNGQYWNAWKFQPRCGKENQEKEINKTEHLKDWNFDYLKFIREQIYTPLLIEKQIEYGIYNWVPKEVCHPELAKKQKDNKNIEVDKQLELLKQQQAILDRQIELEKLKERNNRG